MLANRLFRLSVLQVQASELVDYLQLKQKDKSKRKWFARAWAMRYRSSASGRQATNALREPRFHSAHVF